MQNQKLSLLNHVFHKESQDFKRLPFESLLNIYNQKDDYHFKQSLIKQGYYKSSYALQKNAENDVKNRNWEWISQRPVGLVFYLKDYHRDFILSPQNDENQLLTKHDFAPIEGLPNDFIEKLELTRYELIKSLYPVFCFAQFKPGEGKTAAYVTNLAPYMALDIDIKYDNEEEMLSKLGKYVDVFCCLTSPSGGLRPVIRIDTSNEMMLQLTKWQFIDIDNQSINHYLPGLYKTYLHVAFDKISRALQAETLLENGIPTPFNFDYKCKNLNRFWYISRNVNRPIEINPNAQAVAITRVDCIRFSKKLFPATNCLFGSAF
tara:strand:- start:81879 stop:82835 length:957 start_codon:yes stop_codon:yes gene_type:complete